MNTSSSLGHVPEQGKPWAFDASVAARFDDMLERSIPQYHAMREVCFLLGKRFVTPNTFIVDLGCSRGEALAAFVREFGARNKFLGIESSKPMLDAARDHFEGYTASGIVEIRERDLRTYYPPVDASLVLCVLTLQFLPINYRARVLSDAYHSLRTGGALIVVEKVLGDSSDIDQHLVAEYHALKKRHGYSADEIDRKALALEGVLVPVTASWNEQGLHSAGFRSVDCFWRYLNFAGWLAIK